MYVFSHRGRKHYKTADIHVGTVIIYIWSDIFSSLTGADHCCLLQHAIYGA